MKMTNQHFTQISSLLDSCISKSQLSELQVEYKQHDLSEKRLRWDIFNACVPLPFICQVLYKYLNDEHIDTALRKWIKGKQS